MNLRAPYSPPLSARKAPAEANRTSIMTIRTRKFIGTIALLLLVVVWSLMGMTVAQTPWLANSGLLQAIFYVVAGIGWVLPAMPIISWMARPDA
jgi:type VI protein secretion system component VasF